MSDKKCSQRNKKEVGITTEVYVMIGGKMFIYDYAAKEWKPLQ